MMVAQLRDDLVFRGGLHQLPHLVDRVGQRLLAVDVFAAADGRHGGHGVRVVGRGDEDGVHPFLHGVEHLAEIVERLGLGKLLQRALGPLGVDIA
jgi:hypothetical protein